MCQQDLINAYRENDPVIIEFLNAVNKKLKDLNEARQKARLHPEQTGFNTIGIAESFFDAEFPILRINASTQATLDQNRESNILIKKVVDELLQLDIQGKERYIEEVNKACP